MLLKLFLYEALTRSSALFQSPGQSLWKHAPSEASHLNLHPKRYLRNHWWSNIVHVVFEGSMFNMFLFLNMRINALKLSGVIGNSL